MKVVVIPVTPYQQNCSLIICEETKKAAVVDPGGEVERLLSAIKNHQVSVDKIILTHGHLDHVGGTEALAAHLSIPIIGPEKEDAFWLNELEAQGKPALEVDLVFSIIQSILGYQTQSRMNIPYQPRESGDQEVSEIST